MLQDPTLSGALKQAGDNTVEANLQLLLSNSGNSLTSGKMDVTIFSTGETAGLYNTGNLGIKSANCTLNLATAGILTVPYTYYTSGFGTSFPSATTSTYLINCIYCMEH